MPYGWPGRPCGIVSDVEALAELLLKTYWQTSGPGWADCWLTSWHRCGVRHARGVGAYCYHRASESRMPGTDRADPRVQGRSRARER